MKKLEAQPWAKAIAVWSAAIMLLLGVLGNLGIYTSAAEQMARWHIFFSLSLGGIIAGMIEAAVVSYILVYLFVWMFNRINA